MHVQEWRVVDVLFHGAPLNLFLRPDLVQPVRPRAPELILVQREELGVPGHTGLLAPLSVRALFVASALAVFWLRRALYVTGPTSRL